MLINPKIFTQQNNIFLNRKHMTNLSYSNNTIFYTILDEAIESGKTVKVTFAAKKMMKDCGLQERISNCANGQEFFDLMFDFWKTTKDAIKNVATRNIFGLWELCKDQTLKILYRSYQVEFCFENSTCEYYLRLVPDGEGTKSKAWMYIV